MSQRNPMNERYQQEGRMGKTRKSAASAKPATKAAASVHIPGEGPKPKGFFARAQAKSAAQQAKKSKQPDRAQPMMSVPKTPEYKKWRKWWGITIALAIIFTVLSFVIMMVAPQLEMFGYVLLAIGYIFLAVSLWIDLGKVKKLRNQAYAGMGSNRSKAATRARKEAKARAKAEAEKRAEEAARKEVQKEVQKQARKEKGFFGARKKNQETSEASTSSDSATK